MSNNQEKSIITAICNTAYNAVFFLERSSEVALKAVEVSDKFMDTAVTAAELANKSMQSGMSDLDKQIEELSK